MKKTQLVSSVKSFFSVAMLERIIRTGKVKQRKKNPVIIILYLLKQVFVSGSNGDKITLKIIQIISKLNKMPKDEKGHCFLKPELSHSTLLFQIKIRILKSLS